MSDDTKLIRVRVATGTFQPGQVKRVPADYADLLISGGWAEDVGTLEARLATERPVRQRPQPKRRKR